MRFIPVHANRNVLDLEKSIEFYSKALQMTKVRTKHSKDGSFILVFMAAENGFEVELTWLKDRVEPYNLGDNEIHLAFRVDDFKKAKALHEQMDCIVYENASMGIYFIEDPDGYWIEIIPTR